MTGAIHQTPSTPSWRRGRLIYLLRPTVIFMLYAVCYDSFASDVVLLKTCQISIWKYCKSGVMFVLYD